MVRNRVLPCALRTWRSLGHLLEGPAFVTLPTWHPGRTAGLVPEQSHLSTNQTDDAWLGWELRLSANLEGLFLVLLSVEGRGGPTRPFFSQTRVSALGGCGREGRLPRHRGCSPRGGGGTGGRTPGPAQASPETLLAFTTKRWGPAASASCSQAGGGASAGATPGTRPPESPGPSRRRRWREGRGTSRLAVLGRGAPAAPPDAHTPPALLAG